MHNVTVEFMSPISFRGYPLMTYGVAGVHILFIYQQHLPIHLVYERDSFFPFRYEICTHYYSKLPCVYKVPNYCVKKQIYYFLIWIL